MAYGSTSPKKSGSGLGLIFAGIALAGVAVGGYYGGLYVKNWWGLKMDMAAPSSAESACFNEGFKREVIAQKTKYEFLNTVTFGLVGGTPLERELKMQDSVVRASSEITKACLIKHNPELRSILQ